MLVSIVIPAYNEERLLPRTLPAVDAAAGALRRLGWEIEVIVCDNQSTDRTAEIARAHGVRVVFEPINQIARARNTGAAAASGDWLLFLDADSVPTDGLLAEAGRLIAGGDILFAGAVVQLDTDVPWFEGLLVRGWNALSRRLAWMAGSFILVEADAFREVGGFSLKLYAAEELDLSRRLKKVARRRSKRVTIITRHPLVSSARRFRLYSRMEMLRFFLGAMLRPRATIASRDRCAMWYDGRR